MSKSIFDILTECATDETFDHILFQDAEYKKIYDEITCLKAQLQESKSQEGKLMIENLACAYSLLENSCIKLAYQKGIRDCAALLVEIGLIKDGKLEEPV